MKARKPQTQSTLLDPVYSVSVFAKTEAEVVATVAHLVNSGRVRLCGNFAGAKISFESPRAVVPPPGAPENGSPGSLSAAGGLRRAGSNRMALFLPYTGLTPGQHG